MATKRMTPAKKGATKKAKPAKAVMKPNKLTVADYIASLDSPGRRAEAETLVKIFEKATGWDAKMWGPSIIGFGAYTYTYESGRQGDSCIVGFSPRKAAISLYVSSNDPAVTPLLEKLGKTRKEVSCVYANKLADIDLAVLEKIVKVSKTNTLKKYKGLGWPVNAG